MPSEQIDEDEFLKCDDCKNLLENVRVFVHIVENVINVNVFYLMRPLEAKNYE